MLRKIHTAFRAVALHPVTGTVCCRNMCHACHVFYCFDSLTVRLVLSTAPYMNLSL